MNDPHARSQSATTGILLARHGETNDNLEPIRVQGFSDTPLNDTGRRQAAELAERVAGEGIVSLWSSDLARARETAEIVGARVGLEPRLDARLREADRGRWEGRLFIDIAREEPELYAAWRCQTHGDWKYADMKIYRRRLSRYALRKGINLGPQPPKRPVRC